MSATDRRRAVLEGIAFGPETGEQARLRALELLERLDEREGQDWTPEPHDFAEELADDEERLSRLIELADECLFADLPAYRERVERRALEIVEEQAVARRADFAVVDAHDAQETTAEDDATAEPPPPSEQPRRPENGSRRLEPSAGRRGARPFGGRAPGGDSFWGMSIE